MVCMCCTAVSSPRTWCGGFRQPNFLALMSEETDISTMAHGSSSYISKLEPICAHSTSYQPQSSFQIPGTISATLQTWTASKSISKVGLAKRKPSSKKVWTIPIDFTLSPFFPFPIQLSSCCCTVDCETRILQVLWCLSYSSRQVRGPGDDGESTGTWFSQRGRSHPWTRRACQTVQPSISASVGRSFSCTRQLFLLL